MTKEPITVTGLEKLKKELSFLKEMKRPEIVSAISEARSHGDLKENAEYHAAKEQQAHNEGRIQEIEDLIARANVIDVKNLKNEGKVIFGSTVYLIDLDNNKIHFHKNGSYQRSSDPANNTGGDSLSSSYNNYWTPWMSKDDTSNNSTVEFNFGNPTFTVSSSEADDNGYGSFEYDVPTGYYSICTKNIAEFG